MPWFSPPAFQYVAWPNPPEGCPRCGSRYVMGHCPTCTVYEDLPHHDPEFAREWDRYQAEQAAKYASLPPVTISEQQRARGLDRLYEETMSESYTCPECGESVEDCICAWPREYRDNPGSLGPISGSYWPSPNPLEWHPGGSHRQHGRHYPGSGRRHHHGRPARQFHPGGGVRYRGAYHPGGGHYEANPFGLDLGFDGSEPPPERDWFVPNPLFGFGGPPDPPPERDWFSPNPFFAPEDPPAEREWFAKNPSHYPTPLAQRVCRRIARGGGTEREIWDDVDAVLRHGKSNPSHEGYVEIWGYEVPVMKSKSGKYHHARVADPDEFTAIRTKTLSQAKGIKARIGRYQGRGPRGGSSEIQSYLFDATMYTPDDVIRWIESHDVPAPLLVEWSPVSASSRRMAVRPKKKAPKKRAAKKKVKKKAKKVPARRKKKTTRRKKKAG